MSATARSTGAPDRRPSRYTGPLRVGTHRTGVVRTGTARGTARTAPAGQGRTPPRAPLRSAPVRPDLRLVTAAPARGRRPRSRRAPFVLLVLALLVGTTLSLLVLNTAIAVDSLKATALRQQNDHRTQEEQRLRQQVINGSTPQQLAADAAAAGLVPPGRPGYLVVQPHGSSLRGAPSPAPAPASLPPAAPAGASPQGQGQPPVQQPGQPPAQQPGQPPVPQDPTGAGGN